MAKNFILGIDIGSASIQSVIAGWDKRGGAPRILGIGQSESLGVRRGKITNIEDVSKAIKSSVSLAEKKAGLKVRSAVLSVGGSDLNFLRSRGLIMVSRASGEISEFDAKRALEQALSNIEPLTNREVLHSFPIFFTVDGKFKTENPVGMAGSKLECEAIFIIAINKDVRNVIRASELAGLAVEDVIASPIASARAVLSKRHKEMGSILIDIGAGTTSLAAFEEGSPISLEVLPYGSGNITADLAIGLKLPIDEAEEIKNNFSSTSSSPAKKQTAEIISARLSDIFELANKHLKKIDRFRLLPAGIVISGGGAKISDITSFAKDYLGLPAQIGELEELRMPDGLDSARWSVAVGLCLMAYDGISGKGFNLSGNNVWQWIRVWVKSFLP